MSQIQSVALACWSGLFEGQIFSKISVK